VIALTLFGNAGAKGKGEPQQEPTAAGSPFGRSDVRCSDENADQSIQPTCNSEKCVVNKSKAELSVNLHAR
jgi:hypothetical protein